MRQILKWLDEHDAPPWWVGVLIGWALAMTVRFVLKAN